MKKTKVLSGLALVAGTVAISANAQAEEVTAPITTETPVTTAQEATETKVTTEALAQASEVATSTQANADSQASVVATASSEVTSQSAVVSSLTSEVAKANVTEQDLSNAQATIESAQGQVTATSEALKTAQETETTAQDKVSSQESIVADAQAKASETASAVAEAQSKVDALSGSTDTTALEQGVADLTTKVASDKDAVSSAQSALESAKLAESNKAEAVSQQQKVVAEAEQAVDSSAKALVEATSTKDSTQSVLSEAQSTLETAQKGKTVTETIQTGETTSTTGGKTTIKADTVPSVKVGRTETVEVDGIFLTDELISAYKAGSGVASAASSSKWFDGDFYLFSPQRMASLVKYPDGNTLYVDDLSDATITDLTLFAAALINDARAKVGTEPLKVTSESVAKTRQWLDTYFKAYYLVGENQSWSKDELKKVDWGYRDFTTIFTVSQEEVRKQASDTVLGSSAKVIEVNEQLQGSYLTEYVGSGKKLTITEGQLKDTVFRAVSSALYFDGVSLDLLGLTSSANSFGLELLREARYMYKRDGWLTPYLTLINSSGEALSNPYETVTGGTTTVTPIYETVTRTVVDPVLVAKAQSNLTKAQADFNNAQSAYETARTAYETAQATFTSAQSTLADLINGTVDVASLETALTEAQATLSQDEQALQAAKETLALAKASATDKAIALSKAQAVLTSAKEADALAQSTLAEAQATLAQLKAELSQAQSATADAKTAYTNAQATLETAKAQLKAMKTAQANLPSLVEQLTQAQAKLEELEALLATEEENLADLEAIADEALAIYEALLAQYQTQEAQAQHDAIIKNGGQPVAIKDENGVIVAYVDGRADEKQAIQTAYNKAVTKQVSAKVLKEKPQANYQAKSATLPNTGDDQTAIFSLMGLAMLGLAGVGVKRKL